LLDDIETENGLKQIEALVHFYFKEEPKDIDRLILLWNRAQFVMEFKGELSKKEITLG
jgi:hypothetical protein